MDNKNGRKVCFQPPNVFYLLYLTNIILFQIHLSTMIHNWGNLQVLSGIQKTPLDGVSMWETSHINQLAKESSVD